MLCLKGERGMLKENGVKVNKSTRITYIISLFLLLLFLVVNLLVKFSNIFPKSIFYDLITLSILVFFYISLFISVIFGIINFVKNKDKIVRKNIIIMYVLIILVNAVCLVIPSKIYNVMNENYEKILNKKAVDLLDKLENTDKYILLYNDLKSFDSDISKFGKESYMLYNNSKELYICLEYKNKIIYGVKDNFKYSTRKYCDFNSTKVSNTYALESYIKEYLESKYNIEIEEVESNIVDEFCIDATCVPGTGHVQDFDVHYNNEIFVADLNVINDKIVITDNIQLDFSDNNVKLAQLNEKFTNNELTLNFIGEQTNDIENGYKYVLEIFIDNKQVDSKIFNDTTNKIIWSTNYASNFRVLTINNYYIFISSIAKQVNGDYVLILNKNGEFVRSFEDVDIFMDKQNLEFEIKECPLDSSDQACTKTTYKILDL